MILASKEEIENKLKSIGLKPKASIIKAIQEKKHFFNSICETKTGKKVFLKILLRKEKHFYLSIIRNIKTVEFLSKNAAFKDLNFPRYITGEIKGNLPWFIHEYIKGELIGNFYDIHSKYQNKKYLPLIIKNLKILHSVSRAIIKKMEEFVSELEFTDYKFYPQIVKNFQKYEREISLNYDKIFDFLKINEITLNFSRKVIVHGDFTLANQFFSQDKIYLTDWEWARIGNFAEDIAHLWIQTWRYPSWRKNLLTHFFSSLSNKEKKEFKEIFYPVLLIQALNEIRWNSKICKKKYKRGVINSSIKTINDILKGVKLEAL